MDISFIPALADLGPDDAVAVLAFEDGLSAEAEALDKAAGGALTRAFGRRFRGARATNSVLVSPQGAGAGLVLLIGGGARDALDEPALEQIGGEALGLASSHGMKRLVIALPSPTPIQAARAVLGARLGSYRFHMYKTLAKDSDKVSVEAIQAVAADAGAAKTAYAPLSGLADGVFLCRDLVSEPGNVLHPEEYARRMQALKVPGLEVEIVGEKALTEMGAGLLVGVGLGSPYETCLAVMSWRGHPDKDAAPIVMVGKGVTFDTGGLNIKTSETVDEMKADMGGSAAIAGAMLALALRGAKVNAIGVLALVENSVDGLAMRPGDIIKSLSGRTVEVVNTDAEGRLALADALWYSHERFKPKYLVDVATLTGAVMIALGPAYAGAYVDDDELCAALIAAGDAEGERLWRMPIPEAYDKYIESLHADSRNLGAGIGRLGAASIAARFIRPFAGGTPWAHLDISAPAWPTTKGTPTVPPGAPGWGVRLLHRFVSGYEAP